MLVEEQFTIWLQYMTNVVTNLSKSFTLVDQHFLQWKSVEKGVRMSALIRPFTTGKTFQLEVFEQLGGKTLSGLTSLSKEASTWLWKEGNSILWEEKIDGVIDAWCMYQIPSITKALFKIHHWALCFKDGVVKVILILNAEINWLCNNLPICSNNP